MMQGGCDVPILEVGCEEVELDAAAQQMSLFLDAAASGGGSLPGGGGGGGLDGADQRVTIPSWMRWGLAVQGGRQRAVRCARADVITG